MKNKQQGFTLFEVLISMFIAGVAVLGLVMLELNILRSSQSSFKYTIATIEANTLVDRVWRNLCIIKGIKTPVNVVPDTAKYGNLYTVWKGNLADHGLSASASTTFVLNDNVVISWEDKNFDVSANDSVTLIVPYPDFSVGCK